MPHHFPQPEPNPTQPDTAGAFAWENVAIAVKRHQAPQTRGEPGEWGLVAKHVEELEDVLTGAE
jgi:hypothetical protein